MLGQIEKYLFKLHSQGLADKEEAVFLGLDADLFSNKPIKDEVFELSKLFDLMNINTILFSAPLQPYRDIINEIVRYDLLCIKQNRLIPLDCETRTFFHDIPVIDEFSAHAIAEALSHRKAAIIKDRGIVTCGTVMPEQAFVSFSSTCFSTFVKYFFDSLMYFERCHSDGVAPDIAYISNFERIIGYLRPFPVRPLLSSMPPEGEDDVMEMLSEAGKAIVNFGLVDSYFGNISYVLKDKIYISQTGSSLDELECCIDAVPLDGSSSTGITASSELSAHKNIHIITGDNAILHGHPKFSVIMSMYCLKDCKQFTEIDYCYRRCSRKRYINDIPVVSGEIGTGPAGLMNTVPWAMKDGRGVIVFGHGVFTSGRNTFQDAFNKLLMIEEMCKEHYLLACRQTGASSHTGGQDQA